MSIGLTENLSVANVTGVDEQVHLGCENTSYLWPLCRGNEPLLSQQYRITPFSVTCEDCLRQLPR